MTLAFEKTFDSAAEEYDKIRPSYRYDSSLYVCGMEKDNLLAVGEI